jgi:hypothetical protein
MLIALERDACDSLSEIVFESDSKLQEIGKSVLCNSGIRSIRIPSNVEHTEMSVFMDPNFFMELSLDQIPN